LASFAVRARIFLRELSGYRFGCELEATDADDAWRRVEASPVEPGRRLQAGDVVYVGDVYSELNGDGGWEILSPGTITRELYGLIPTS
jgi:hypothetical protein